MKVLFMGTPAFAADSLSALLEAGHDVVAAVTRPDAGSGRGREVRPGEVKHLAARRGIQVLQPAGIRSDSFLAQAASLDPAIVVVVAFGRILPAPLLTLAPLGAVNVHASLLPRLRGAAPIAWAIVRGETETGVTTQRIVEKVDAGDILLQRTTPIGQEETAGQLERRLAAMGADLLVETLAGLESGRIAPRAQDPSLVTYAPRLKKGDGVLDWTLDARALLRRVRGFDPWPAAHTSLAGGRRLIVWRARPAAPPESVHPGTVFAGGRGGVLVACGTGEAVELLEVQPEGRARMPARAALAGRHLRAGDRLGLS